VKCPLCGHEFEEAREACSACPLHAKGCGMVCCPRCGYTIPGESKVLKLIKRIWGRRR